jgi:hypothetical protein
MTKISEFDTFRWLGKPNARFGSDVSVELDAIDPRKLRQLVEGAIRKHMPKKRYEELMLQEQKEKALIESLIATALANDKE